MDDDDDGEAAEDEGVGVNSDTFFIDRGEVERPAAVAEEDEGHKKAEAGFGDGEEEGTETDTLVEQVSFSEDS